MVAVALVPQQIWTRLTEGWRNMADLADRIDDLICSFDGLGDTTMDTIAMYMFGWMLFGLLVLAVGKYVYGRVAGFLAARGGKSVEVAVPPPPVAAKGTVVEGDATKTAAAVVSGSAAPKYVPPTPPMRKRLGSKSGRPSGPAKPKKASALVHPPPAATGPDSDSVKWVNELFSWLYSDLVIVNELLNIWVHSLNEFTKQSVAEHGVGVEFVRVLGETQSPSLSNVFCECAPNEDVVSEPTLKFIKLLQSTSFSFLTTTMLKNFIYFVVTHRDFLQLSPSQNTFIPTKTASKRLLVKIIKATGIGLKAKPLEPFCVVELDDPPQKNQTSVKKDTENPNWDEHFLFDVTNSTAEILLEVYDKSPVGKGENKFLGLGIVGMDELVVNPSQRQTISLQSRPYFQDDVTGTLTVEFLLIEGAEIPVMGDRPYKLKETLRSVSPSGATITTVKTVFTKQNSEALTNGGGDVTDSALRELERNKQSGMSTPASKSTLIIHSVQRQPQQRQLLKVEQTETGNWLEVTDKKAGFKDMPGQIPTTIQQSYQQSAPYNPQQQSPLNETLDERGRSRKKKRDFFGTIKRRLNRSKVRSKSMDPGESDESGLDPLNRSISADRARDPSAHSAHSTGSYLSVPSLREGSARSSLSEASGISGASTRTYVNEASTLVLESVENGVLKYYLVPLSLAQRGKWKKKGIKLHIFNDHTFIAKHLPGGTQCQVCRKMLARRLGKQGYECRDCLLKCHKHCHIRAEVNCPSSNIHTIELCSDLQSPFSVRKMLKKR
ncbi:uncharacterized protein LOC111044175 [Nilaparvata lugens]|uniref:uncharacterized protein LOC111044175 n=1 Tax=Nilaparvata lugens TaxID=108931 RepID=UPI00193CD646|nr:uncharacterized protein LOC111044175 [Nilaparvata lugens]